MPTIKYERLPDQKAKAHFDQKTLMTSADFANVKAYQHALAFTVAHLADQDMLSAIHKAIKTSIDNGTSFTDFKKTLLPYLKTKGFVANDNPKLQEKQLNRRLKIIYQTNRATAFAAGQWQRLQATKKTFPYLEYRPSLSTHKRDEHKAYYGIIRHIDDPIWQSIFPPNGFGCFLGDVQIQGNLQSAMVKWYEGIAIHLTTQSGRSLAVTANHPILTARGWVRADGLTTSDDVLCYGLPIDTVNADGLSGQIHHNQAVPTAKNLFKAFFDQTFAFAGTTAFKFNSDVANGEIHIDVVNNGLVCHIWADVLQGVKQVELIRGDDGGFIATGKSDCSPDFATVIGDFIGSQNTGDITTTAIKTLCQSTLAYFGCGVQMNDFSFQFVITRATDRPSLSTLPFNTANRLFDVLPTSNTGTAHISQDNTILTELASNACTTDFGLFGYLIDAHSSLVFADPVINIRQFSFSGHVYDFQSSESIVSANGIIAHNCKCFVRPLTAKEAQDKGITPDTTIKELPKPDFDSNFDRLGSLLRLAKDRHGAGFAKLLKEKTDDFMVDLIFQPDFVKGLPTVLDGGFEKRFNELKPKILEVTGGKMANSETVRDLQEKLSNQNNFAVATISPSVQELLEAKTAIIYLSDDNLIKEIARHPKESTIELFRNLSYLIKNSDKIIQDNEFSVVYFAINDKRYKITVKTTKSRKALFLGTIFELNTKNYEREINNTQKNAIKNGLATGEDPQD